MENPPDLAYDCIKGSRILGENETKQNHISQSEKKTKTKNNKIKTHQLPPKKFPKHPNHQPPKKRTLAVSGYRGRGVKSFKTPKLLRN